jgi:hypothetical protein
MNQEARTRRKGSKPGVGWSQQRSRAAKEKAI